MPKDFDADVWRAQRGSTARETPRTGLVVPLERNHLHKGMTRAAVIELLGEPDRCQPRSDHYRLGASPVGIDFETYVIEYDEQDRVSGFGIRRS